MSTNTHEFLQGAKGRKIVIISLLTGLAVGAAFWSAIAIVVL